MRLDVKSILWIVCSNQEHEMLILYIKLENKRSLKLQKLDDKEGGVSWFASLHIRLAPRRSAVFW